MYDYPSPHGAGPNRPYIPNEADKQFEDHMRPDIFWLADPAFDQAFRDLTGDTSMTEAAYTKPGCDYPGFVNAQARDGEMLLTVRGDPAVGPPGQNDPEKQVTICAPVTSIRIPLEDWDQFIADAQRIRASLE